MLLRGLRERLGLTDASTGDDTPAVFADLRSPKTQMAIALGAVKRPDQVYGGTVPYAVVQRRRAANRRARAARRITRLRAR